MDYRPALNDVAHKLLSSRLPKHIRQSEFYGDGHRRHTDESSYFVLKNLGEQTTKYEHVTLSDISKFHENPDVLTIGCSFTEAGALPSMLNWSRIIEQSTGLKVNNCGYPGSGVAFEVGYACDVIRNFGAPKQIYALFPNIDRAWLPYKIDEIEEQIDFRHIDWDASIGAYVAHHNNRSGERIFHEFALVGSDGEKYLIPPELIVFYSFLFIDALEVLCKAGGIEFKFSTWHQKEQNIFNRYLRYDSYVPVLVPPTLNKSVSPLLDSWRKVEADQAAKGMALRHGPRPWEIFGVDGKLTCDHEPQTSVQNDYWVIAADGRHAGVHDHIHFAEHFTQQQITNEMISSFVQ